MSEQSFDDLRAIFEYYKYFKQEPYDAIRNDKLKNDFSDDGMLFRFIVDYYEFNKYPVVVPTREFNKNNTVELYHGFKEYDFGANFLVDWNYHYGNGYNDGFYLTDSFDVAKTYTGGFPSSQSNGLIMRVKPLTGNFARISEINSYVHNFHKCDNENIKNRMLRLNEFYDYCLKNGESEKLVNNFYNCLVYNPSSLAVYLGFDFCIDDTFHDHVIVFNRGAVCIPENDAKRFLNKSQEHKDGVLNKFESFEQTLR